MPFSDNLPAENTDPWYSGFATAWANLKTFVNGLETSLGNKVNTSTYTSGLAGKANTVHTHVAADTSDFAEVVRDTMGTALVAGTNVTLTVNDAGDTITIAATGGTGGGGLDVEAAIDAVAASLVPGTNVTITYDDTAGTITIGTTGLATSAALTSGLATKITAFADPNADRIVFWDDSAGAFAALIPGAGFTISGTTLSFTGTAGNQVEYDAIGDAWPARPAISGIVIFYSTKDPAALRPPDMAVGDIWIQHPDALASL